MAYRRSGQGFAVHQPDIARDILPVVRATASRLRQPKLVETAIQSAAAQAPDPRSAPWLPYGVAQGYAGLAIACGQLDRCFPEEKWDTVAHHYLTCAARDSEQNGIRSLGLHGGLAGLAFAASYLSRGGRYQTLRDRLDEQLIANLPGRLGNADGSGLPVSEFDVISGSAGIGAYLLSVRDKREARKSLRQILRWLVSITAQAEGRPAWWTPAHLMADRSMAEQNPGGVLNCGLAHGIPGPLALMSLARLHGIRVAGMTAAIRRIAKWLCTQQLEDDWGVGFPASVPIERGTAAPCRCAWCYGSPGVARALWLAGRALDDPALCAFAVKVMLAVLQRPIAARRIDGPGFCHGIAGLLQIVSRFAKDTRRREFREAEIALTRQLLEHFETKSILGFRSLEAGGARVDRPGVLEGSTGILLVLLSTISRMPPDWDRLFMLS